MSFKYPDPPEYYKKFEEGEEPLDPPDLDKIKEVCSEYFVFGMRRTVTIPCILVLISFCCSLKKTLQGLI